MQEKEKIGLYFGSFNPIHVGHLILAEYILQNSDLNKICFVVSPQNPLKDKAILLDNSVRYELLQLAVKDNPDFVVSDVEFNLPVPSYTVNTLRFLQDKYNDGKKEFALIMGEDNLAVFDKWKDYSEILQNFDIYVYPRRQEGNFDKCKSEFFLKTYASIHLIDAPMIDISSSYIRNCIKNGKSIKYLVTESVREEIERQHLYL